MWGFCLCNYELQLIQLYPINATAWIYIVVAWVSLYFGAATMLLLSPPGRRVVGPAVVVDLGLLKKMIMWSSVIGALGLVSQLIAVAREFGNPFVAVIVDAGEAYGGRSSGEVSVVGY